MLQIMLDESNKPNEDARLVVMYEVGYLSLERRERLKSYSILTFINLSMV